MIFNTETADKIVKLLLPLIDTEYGHGKHVLTHMSFTVTEDFIQALMQSDDPHAGYVLSSIVPRDQSTTVYNEWTKLAIERSMVEEDIPVDDFIDHFNKLLGE